MKSAGRRWLRYLLPLDLALLAAVLGWVLLQAVPSSEAVRLRNALLFEGVESASNLTWAPTAAPADFRLERQPAPASFAAIARSLDLAGQPDDWSRALVIARHLQSRLQDRGPIMAGLDETYWRITTEGKGYCGDFVRVFAALAHAAGLITRQWSFSFNGYGGYGHTFNEVWDSGSRQWRAIDVYNNYLFVDAATGAPLSALEFRAALLGEREGARIVPLSSAVRLPYGTSEKAVDYYRRGAREWYVTWGNSVFSVDQHPLVRLARPLSRHAEQLAAIVAGVQPGLRVVATAGSEAKVMAMSDLRRQLIDAAVVAGVLLTGAIVLVVMVAWPALPEALPPRERRSGRKCPAIVVFSSLFPSPAQPQAGIFIRERMFRVAEEFPLLVVAPRAWFPLQGIIRLWWPHFRPPAPGFERQNGIDIFRPRFLSMPGLLKRLDGLSMALCSYSCLRRLKRQGRLELLDAHFAYPDGYAAVRLARWLGVPVTITLRGKEARQAQDAVLVPRLRFALQGADRVFTVSAALLECAEQLGLEPGKGRVVQNGVDANRFRALPRSEARSHLQLPATAPVIVSVGGLVERKGFHRVIEQMPDLLKQHPDLHYIIVGAAGPEGDYSPYLRALIHRLGLDERVHFLGAMSPDQLCVPLSAADVFVLATRYEGWANVFLEAMACGLPVVTTDVGGNREVVRDTSLGTVVPFGDGPALCRAVSDALRQNWDRGAIRTYAEQNDWARQVAVLVAEFGKLASRYQPGLPAGLAALDKSGQADNA